MRARLGYICYSSWVLLGNVTAVTYEKGRGQPLPAFLKNEVKL